MNLLPHQVPPPSDWRRWVIIGRNGDGKTTAAAAWGHAMAMSGDVRDLVLIGLDFYMAREIMAMGHSGVLSVAPASERPTYSRSRNLLTWANGVRAHLFSAEEPDRLAGLRADAAWAEELPRWCLSPTWTALQHALRFSGRSVVTANPHTRIVDDVQREATDAFMKDLLRQPGTVTTQGARHPHVL